MVNIVATSFLSRLYSVIFINNFSKNFLFYIIKYDGLKKKKLDSSPLRRNLVVERNGIRKQRIKKSTVISETTPTRLLQFS